MQKTTSNGNAKNAVSIINGFEINAKALYPLSLLSKKSGISVKKLRKLIKDKELTAKKISKEMQITGYSFIEWMNRPDEETKQGSTSEESSEKE